MNFATEIQYYKDKLKVLRGVNSQVRKFASNVFIGILDDLDRYAHIDCDIKIHTVSGGCFLWCRLLEGCCRVRSEIHNESVYFLRG